MFHKLFNRRGAVALATVALGISGMSLAFAGTAGAADTLPNASLLVGSGSNTAYSLMVAEGNLFNTAPGCDLTISGSSDPLNMNCGTATEAPGNAQTNPNAGENGYTQANENPYDDYTVQAPAVGSGSGVNQLKNTTAGEFQPNYARSSGAPALPTARPSRTTRRTQSTVSAGLPSGPRRSSRGRRPRPPCTRPTTSRPSPLETSPTSGRARSAGCTKKSGPRPATSTRRSRR